jgi:phosphoenolpyruvate carboxykinase (GTP)
VNWFRKGADGKFLWPGYGENARVLKWMFERIEGKGAATETPIGAVPTENAITLDGINVSRETMNELLRVDPADWAKEHAEVGKFFEIFGNRLPAGIKEEHDRRGQRLQRMATVPK